jgi:carboxyl-terminal processing protease
MFLDEVMLGAMAALCAAVPSGARVLDEIGGIVEKNFYSAPLLEEVGWNAAVERARLRLGKETGDAAQTRIFQDLLATLRTSHTAYYPRTDPAYWQLTALFESHLGSSCPKDRLPPLPVRRADVGVFWRQVEGAWFVGGVFGGGPADKAGLKLGDRIAAADGHPFSPVTSFAGREGKAVALEVQRTREGAPLALTVTPRSSRPFEELRQASADSWRVIEHKGRRIGYLHMWAWATIDFQQVALDAVVKSNQAGVDGFVFDIRDGWGGASVGYLTLFSRDLPRLESVGRDGKKEPFDQQIRVPSVLLVNGGTRSGKETIAYGAKKLGLSRLVGERTAGAVVFGRPFCLGDGSLLYLAVAEARVDGQRLEGVGVAPDVEVPFDFRYAAGKDAQLERALDLISGDR